MASFVWELALAVVVTLFALSQANVSPSQCDPYNNEFGEQKGLVCPQSDQDSRDKKTYCCQTITGNIIMENCCIKSEWEKNPSSNPLFSKYAILGFCFLGSFVICFTIVVIRVRIVRKRRERIHRETRAAAQAVVVGGHVPAPHFYEQPVPHCYEQPAKVGQYRQFQNDPIN